MRRTLFTFLSAIALVATGVVGAIAVGGTGTVDPPPRIAFLANGIVPADALAAGGIAGQLGAPLFTTRADVLAPAARDGIAAYAPELLVVLGGEVAVKPNVMEDAADAADLEVVTDPTARPDTGAIRVGGDTRFDTAAAVAALLGDYDVAFLPVDATAVGALDAATADRADQAGVSDTAGFASEAGDATTLGGLAPDDVSFPDDLPAGQTLIGQWGRFTHSHGDVHSSSVVVYLDFGILVDPASMGFEYLLETDDRTENCPGDAAAPEAAPGFVCVYSISPTNADFVSHGYEGRYGMYLLFHAPGATMVEARGSWAVQRAPAS